MSFNFNSAGPRYLRHYLPTTPHCGGYKWLASSCSLMLKAVHRGVQRYFLHLQLASASLQVIANERKVTEVKEGADFGGHWY